jgi:stage V sporulation protein B
MGPTIAIITERTVGITLTLGILIGGIFFMNANELGVLIFNSKEVGYMIRLLAPIVPFMYLESIADGILKGLNLQKYSLIYNVCDSTVRILAIFIFLRRFGMLGFLGVMIVSNITTSSLNTRRLMISSKTEFKTSEWVIKPLAAVVVGVMLSSFLVSQMGLEGIFKIILSSIITCVIFGVGLIMSGVIGKNELNFGLKVVKKGNFGKFLKNN